MTFEISIRVHEFIHLHEDGGICSYEHSALSAPSTSQRKQIILQFIYLLVN